nr:hypothetical protein [Clostridium sp. C2-6-12]
MENVLIKKLEELNINETALLLNEDVNLSVDYLTRKRIEKAVMKKTYRYSKNNILIHKMNDILGGIIMKKKIALALSAGVIFSLAGGTYAYAKTPVAYVSVDINPSVELGVNAFDTVVSVEAYNEDGKNVLEGTNLVNSKIDDAVSTVVTNAIKEGYIKEDGSSAIEITTATDKEKVADELDEELKGKVDKTLDDNNKEAKVESEKVALARRDEARKLGITPGKLNLIQKLQELDPAITVEEYKDSSVKNIQKKFKELKKDIKNDEKAVKNEDTNINTTSDKNTTVEENITHKNKVEDTNKEVKNISKEKKEDIKNEKAEEAILKHENNSKQGNGNNTSSQGNSNKEKNKNN